MDPTCANGMDELLAALAPVLCRAVAAFAKAEGLVLDAMLKSLRKSTACLTPVFFRVLKKAIAGLVDKNNHPRTVSAAEVLAWDMVRHTIKAAAVERKVFMLKSVASKFASFCLSERQAAARQRARVSQTSFPPDWLTLYQAYNRGAPHSTRVVAVI